MTCDQNMLKWALFSLHAFDVVCFADADLEMMPIAEGSPSAIAHAWQWAVGTLLASNATLVAVPDPQAPMLHPPHPSPCTHPDAPMHPPPCTHTHTRTHAHAHAHARAHAHS